MERSHCVVFDLGGVLLPASDPAAELAELLGASAPDVSAAYWAHRDAYDLGGSAEDYWSAVARDIGRPLEPAAVAALDGIDVRRWSQPPHASIDVLDEVERLGMRRYVLSNAPQVLASTVRAAPWGRALDGAMFSSDVGLMKPDPAVYARAAQVLGITGAAVLFLDDRPVNVEAAREHGWDAHLWAGPEAALAAVRAHASRGALS